jgi:hypothetical protein
MQDIQTKQARSSRTCRKKDTKKSRKKGTIKHRFIIMTNISSYIGSAKAGGLGL